MDLVYLGPEGSYTHRAARALAPQGVRLCAHNRLETVLEAVSEGEARYAVAALDNTLAGPITLTCQAVLSGKVRICGRFQIEVTFDLYRRRGDRTPIKTLFGHEKALAQTRAWWSRHPVTQIETSSSTLGLERLRDGHEAGEAAVGPPDLAEPYGLECVDRAIEGEIDLVTTFILMERADLKRGDHKGFAVGPDTDAFKAKGRLVHREHDQALVELG